MKSKWVPTMFLSTILMLALASTAAFGQTGKCGAADIANGPFTYTALSVTQATFNGSGGSLVNSDFSITSPSVDLKQQTDAPDVFPGEGKQPCTSTAPATISALEIQKVGDASGNPIDPENLDPSDRGTFDDYVDTPCFLGNADIEISPAWD